ncbi:hypothetical protein ACFX11_001007 [Malus domestica]
MSSGSLLSFNKSRLSKDVFSQKQRLFVDRVSPVNQTTNIPQQNCLSIVYSLHQKSDEPQQNCFQIICTLHQKPYVPQQDCLQPSSIRVYPLGVASRRIRLQSCITRQAHCSSSAPEESKNRVFEAGNCRFLSLKHLLNTTYQVPRQGMDLLRHGFWSLKYVTITRH